MPVFELCQVEVPFTWRKLVTAGAAAVFAPAVTAACMVGSVPAAAQQPQSISWSIASHRTANNLQLTIDRRWGANNPAPGRTIGRRRASGSEPLYSWRAGRSLSVRTSERGRPSRLQRYRRGGRGRACAAARPDALTMFLEARGIGRPSPHQSYSLTMSGVGRDLVDALDKNGFARPNIDQLTAMGIHGVTASYVRELGGLGYRLSADDVLAFKIHGVEPDYIRQMATIGHALRRIRPSDLVALRIHGVKPEFVRQMAANGPEFRNVTADDLVSMAIHGVRPELAQTFVQLEGGNLRSDDVVSMAIHGVSADYIRQLAALGYRGLSADDLVSMSIHGVTPSYVQELHRSGMTRLSADQLVRLRISGVPAALGTPRPRRRGSRQRIRPRGSRALHLRRRLVPSRSVRPWPR